jgi:hypothetical protein
LTAVSDGDDATAAQYNALLSALGDGSPAGAASYIMFIDGSNYKVRNGKTGEIDYTGTNAGTVLQSVCDAITAGGQVYIAAGTYPIGTVTLNQSWIRLTGASPFGTILQGTIALNPADGSQARNIVEDLCMDGNGTTAKGIIAENSGVKVPTHYVRNVAVQDYTSRGISLVYSQDNMFDRVQVFSCPTGIYVLDGWGTNGFRDIDCYLCSAYGMYVENELLEINGKVFAASTETGAVALHLDSCRGSVNNIWVEQPSSDNPTIQLVDCGSLKIGNSYLSNKGGATKPSVTMTGTSNSRIVFDTCFFESATAGNDYAVSVATPGEVRFHNCSLYNFDKVWNNLAGASVNFDTFHMPSLYGPNLWKWQTLFETIDGFHEETGGGGTATLGTDYVSLQTGAVGTQYMRLRFGDHVLGDDLASSWGNRLMLELVATFVDDSDQTVYLGVGSSAGSFAGFKVTDDTLYGCTRQAAAETTTALDTFTAPTSYKLRLELQPGLNALFYVDEVYTALVTTNLPTAGNENNQMWAMITTNAAANKELRLSLWRLMQYSLSWI